MEELYATLIVNNKKDFSKVPAIIKDKVDQKLKEKVTQGQITQENYDYLVSK